jgi:c-di-GMP-binding flagellar brake protein YcgR
VIGIGEEGICMSDANSFGMSTTDRRRYKRVKISNPISYVFLDKEGNEIEEGIGTVLNISQRGILLETYLPVKSSFILITYIDLEGQLLNIKGKVIYSMPGESGNFFVGVRFVDTHENHRKMTVSFIKAYHSVKNQSIRKRNSP